MTKAARRHWLKNYKADRIRETFLKDYMKGIISLHELNDIFRVCSQELKLPDLKERKKWNVEAVCETTRNERGIRRAVPFTEQHKNLVLAGLKQRLVNWKNRRLLFKPVTIPGPPPGAELKPVRKRGVLAGKLRTTKRQPSAA